MSVTVRPAAAADLGTVRSLFSEYVNMPRSETLFSDYLAQQDFDRELAELPGAYVPPSGALLVAEMDGRLVGCVALKALEPPNVCEMKRLFVRPEARGSGAGRALVQAVLDAARAAGYHLMRLDTLPSMLDAQRLYRSCGFYEMAQYNQNPVPGSIYFEYKLLGVRG